MQSVLSLSGAEAFADELNTTLGTRVRGLRQSRNLSIAELGIAAGVSVGMISQIERNQANPSLKVLEKLRLALGVSLSQLLEGPTNQSDEDHDEIVRRRANRVMLDVGPHPLSKELLSPRHSRNLQFMYIHFPPNASSDEVIMIPGEKGGIVIHGQFNLTVNGNQMMLDEGDSFQFDAMVGHRLQNVSEDRGTVLWIIAEDHGPASF